MIHDATLGSPVIQSPISFTGSGDQIIVPAVAGVSIGVLQFFFVLNGTANLTYKSGSTALSGALAFLPNGAQVQDFVQLPLKCNVGDPFIINVDVSISLGGTIWYYKAPRVQ